MSVSFSPNKQNNKKFDLLHGCAFIRTQKGEKKKGGKTNGNINVGKKKKERTRRSQMRIGFIESAVSYSSSRVRGKARMAAAPGGGGLKAGLQ